MCASHLCFILARHAWIMEAWDVLFWVKCYTNAEFFLILCKKRKRATASHTGSNRTNAHHFRTRWCIANPETKTKKFSLKKPRDVWQVAVLWCTVFSFLLCAVTTPLATWAIEICSENSPYMRHPGIKYPKKMQYTNTKIQIFCLVAVWGRCLCCCSTYYELGCNILLCTLCRSSRAEVLLFTRYQ